MCLRCRCKTQQSCCAVSLVLLHQLLSVLIHSVTNCSVSVLSGALKTVMSGRASLGQERRKHHQWAKEVLETEWKPGSKKVFFPLMQRLLDYTQKELLGVPENFYITLNSSPSFSQEGRERRVPSVSQKTLRAFQQLENSKPMTSH